MQVIIGQYSHLGVTFMKYLIPIGHGLSYILCINAVIDTVINGIIMGNIIMYLLSSMQKKLPWMYCPTDMDNCWGRDSECINDCLKETVQISAQVFYE